MSEIAVEKTRGELVESKHRAIIAIIDTNNNFVGYLGNPDTVTYWRSAAKPLQVFPLLERNGMEAFGFSLKELAVMCASHSGEEFHTEAVKSILNKIGAAESMLKCGIHPPLDKKTREKLREENRPITEIYNNCSGKHASMLALAKLMEVPLDNYWEIDHPVQQEMLRTISKLTGLKISDITVAKDGCGVPVFGLPVTKMARAYTYFASSNMNTGWQNLFDLVYKAMTTHPKMVAGTDKFNTRLMEVTKGEIIAKSGAQGVFSFAHPRQGLGGTIKVEDGSDAAIGPIMTEVLHQLKLVGNQALSELEPFRKPPIKNVRKEIIGESRPAFSLRQ